MTLILGGITLAVHYLTHPPGETAPYALDPLWVPSHWLGGIAYLLLPLGLIGLYARQSEKAGLLGLIGFILAFVGSALSAGLSIYFSVVVIPFLAVRGLDWLDAPNGAIYTSSAFRLAVGPAAACLLLGLLLFAVATLRAHVLPRLGAWLVILTVPLGVLAVVFVAFIGSTPFLQRIGQLLIGGVLSFGMLIWGWALWSQKDEMLSQTKTKM